MLYLNVRVRGAFVFVSSKALQVIGKIFNFLIGKSLVITFHVSKTDEREKKKRK